MEEYENHIPPETAGSTGPQSGGQTYYQQAPYAADPAASQGYTQQASYGQSQTAGQGYSQQGPVYVEPVQAYGDTGQPKKDDTPVQSIIGLVLGILSILFGCCSGILAPFFGVPGIILSVIGNKKKKTGVGTAGLITSIVGMVFGIFIILLVALGAWSSASLTY